jgi:hypothetical protein
VHSCSAGRNHIPVRDWLFEGKEIIMYDLPKRYPWLIGSGSMIIFLIAALIGTPIGNHLEHWAGLPLHSGVLIQQVLLVIAAALAVIAFRGWREAGFAKPIEFRALLYAVYAGMLGFGFAAPYLRSGGAIWPVIVVHALYDFLGKMGHGWGAQAQQTSSFEILVRLVAAVLVALYGLWLLKSKQPIASGSKQPEPIRLSAY